MPSVPHHDESSHANPRGEEVILASTPTTTSNVAAVVAVLGVGLTSAESHRVRLGPATHTVPAAKSDLPPGGSGVVGF